MAVLREAGVDGPYGIAPGPQCYTGVIETTQKGGYSVLDQLRLVTGRPLAWAPAILGSVVLGLRGGDFELTLGEELSSAARAPTTSRCTSTSKRGSRSARTRRRPRSR